jgi:hypothetical protein
MMIKMPQKSIGFLSGHDFSACPVRNRRVLRISERDFELWPLRQEATLGDRWIQHMQRKSQRAES